jgi:hypothetical protein
VSVTALERKAMIVVRLMAQGFSWSHERLR